MKFKLKKLFLIFLVVTCILSLNAVSAMDLDNSNPSESVFLEDSSLDIDSDLSDYSGCEISSNSIDDENLKLSDYSIKYNDENNTDSIESLGLSNKSFSSFQKILDSASKNDIIKVSGIYSGNKSLIINKSLTIDGSKGLTFTSSDGIFEIRGNNVVLKNINFINSLSGTGLLKIYGKNCTIINCNFTNNTVNSFDVASIILIESDNSSIVNCNFINNKIANHLIIYSWDKEYSIFSHGSIIDWVGDNGLIKDSYFHSKFDYNDTVIFWYGKNGTLKNNVIDINMGYGITIRGGSISNLIVNYNNSFEGFLFNKTSLNLYITDDNGNKVNDLDIIFNITKNNKTVKKTFKLDNGIVSAFFIPENLGIYNISAYYLDSSSSINSLANFNISVLGPVDDKQSFAYIQYLIDIAEENSTIFLNGSYYGDGIPIFVNKSVNIVGIGDTILDGRGLNRIFDIKGNNVKLENLNIQNGCINQYSSANYLSSDNLNSEKYKLGGAIYWYGNNGSLINCTLFNNTISNSSNLIRGGAIYWYGKNGKVINSSFINNYAHYKYPNLMGSPGTGDGGAIYAYGTNLNILSSIFVNNTACRGGAIFWEGNKANVSYSIFDYNYAFSPVLPNWDGMGSAIAFNATTYDFNYNYWVGMDEEWHKIAEFYPKCMVLYGGLIFNANNRSTITPDYWIVLNNEILDSNFNKIKWSELKANQSYIMEFNLKTMVSKKGKKYSFDTSLIPNYYIHLKTINGNKISPKDITLVDGVGFINYTTDKAISDRIKCYNDRWIYIFSTKLFIKVKASNLTTIYRNGDKFKVALLDGSNKPLKYNSVEFRIYKNGKYYRSEYEMTNSKGVAYFNMNSYPANKYTVEIFVYDCIFEEPSNYSLLIKKANGIFKLSSLKTYYKSGKYLKVKLVNKETKKVIKGVKLKFDCYDLKTHKHKFYYFKTNKEGIATLKVNLAVGKYKVKVTSEYKSVNVESQKVNLKISKTKTKLNRLSPDYIKNNTYFKVKLVNTKGKALVSKEVLVKSKLSGKIYHIKTNKKGIAKVKLWVSSWNLNKSLNYFFNFKGDNLCKSTSKTFKLKITK